MSVISPPAPPVSPHRRGVPLIPDLNLALDNLRQRKLRSLLTMLGMIFGVAAVISMLSIGAGAQKQEMAYIEQLGVNNLLIQAKEASDYQSFSQRRKITPGLTFDDLRLIEANVEGISLSTARKRYTPTKMIPKPSGVMPVFYGVAPDYREIENLRVVAGRFFNAGESARSAPVCVLGQGAKASLFGPTDAVGQYIKADGQWYHVIGVAGPELSAATNLSGLPTEDLNNLIYAPIGAVIYRLADMTTRFHDEIDGIYLHLDGKHSVTAAAQIVRGILNATHHNAGDFSVIVPAALLAQQQNTRRIFDIVMVAIASIALLVGGIGIMNIMLASVLERTHEIGVRRAIGARRIDIIRQFVTESMLISLVGGLIGVGFGVGISRLIAWLAGWSTIVTLPSILLAFLVSLSVGLLFGIYPAAKAAHLDPVEALRYE
ncbi:MAG: ABC transporter permease [Terriglobia bacterium]